MIYKWFTIFTWKNIEKVKNLLPNLHDKNEYLMHIRKLKQALSHRLVLKKFTEWLTLIKILG